MIIVLAHKNPDFDALASMAALQKLYPEAHLVVEGELAERVKDFAALAKDQIQYYRLKDLDINTIEKIFLVDTHELKRAVSNQKILAQLEKAEIEVFDHHPAADLPEKSAVGLIEPVGACTTLLVEKIMEKDLYLSVFEATLLALGIYEDTGSLLFESTTPRDVFCAAYLLEKGAELSVIGEYINQPLTREQLALYHQISQNGFTERINGLDIYFAYGETEEYLGGLASLANKIGQLENADAWFLIVKMADRVFLVGRTRGDKLAVNKVLAAFGGAGHYRAAAASLKNGKIEDILFRLQEKIRQAVKRPSLVKDIMSFPVKTVSPETKIEEVQVKLLKYGHTGFPVVDNNRLVGIISRRDTDKAVKHGLEHAPVKGFMTKDVVTVKADVEWEEAHQIMVREDIGRVPVIENGRIVGIISRSDILRMMYKSVVPTSERLTQARSLALRDDIIGLFNELPEKLQQIIYIVHKLASELDYKVYLVGGFVRDLLLRVPTQDLDLTVEGESINFAEYLSKKLDCQKLTVHEQFKTATILLADGTHIDIARTRSEHYAYPGSLPEIEESQLRDDLFRRDFTINAMAINLTEQFWGELIDYYGGLRDLQQGEIRYLHNLSFIDDPTRIIRAVRFSGRYGFELAKITEDAIPIALEQNVFAELSAERFTEELLLVYNESKYQEMIKKLVDKEIFYYWFNNTYSWNCNENDTESWSLQKRWLVSLKEMNESEIEEILSKLKLNKDLSRLTYEYLKVRAKLKTNLKTLIEIDQVLRYTDKVLIDVLFCHPEFKDELEKYQNALLDMDMKISGKTIMELGIEEGPLVGSILEEIRQAWLEGKVNASTEYSFVLRVVRRYL